MEENVQNHIIRLSTLKLKPYKKFIKKLLKIEEQGIVLEKDYRKLCELLKGQILLYLKKENAKPIADSLIIIGRYVGMGNENSRNREELRPPVLKIINTLMRDMGFGGELDETVIKELEKAEDEYFPQLFRQAIKEAFDNVLVNYCDYLLLSRGEYITEEDGEYIVYPFINDYPHGCKIMIGPFTNKADTDILFKFYVPRYVQSYDPHLAKGGGELRSFMGLIIDERELPLSISRPLKDSCLIALEMEDRYNDYIASFSFNDMGSLARYRHNYAEAASALSQRVKYIFLNAYLLLKPMHIYEYIAQLEKIDPVAIYPEIPWRLTADGDIVCD